MSKVTYTADEVRTIERLWKSKMVIKLIAVELGRSQPSIKRKVKQLVRAGKILPRKFAGGTQNKMSTTPVVMRATPALKDKLASMARARGTSLSALCESLIRNQLGLN